MSSNDPNVFQEFREALGMRDPKTIATYLTTMRGFVAWLATQPGGAPFHLGLVTEKQRFVLKQLVEQHTTRRFTAIFALGYWAGLRISEIATLRIDQCQINQRAGSVTLLDAKGGKTRTPDLHNMARRALSDYLFPACPQDRERDEESIYVFTSQRATWLRQQGRPDHLSERGIEHLWMQAKQRGTHEEWEHIAGVTFHDLRHDFAHRARATGWSLEEIAVYLGHQTKDGAPAITTTVRYTLPSRQQLKERIQVLPG